MNDSAANTLYYGDNLDILRRYVEDESVDLIYLDPPFNSNADYNVLFAEKDGTQAHAQITAFEDTWTLSVKGGHVTSSQIRDLRGVVEREEAAIGIFLTLEEPTAPMRKEAAEAGFFQTKSVSGSKHPRLQILTIEELLAGKKIDMPAAQDIRSFKQAPKAKAKKKEEAALF